MTGEKKNRKRKAIAKTTFTNSIKQMSKIFEDIKKTIDDFSHNISVEVAEKRYYEVAEVRAICSTRLSLALQSLIELFIVDAETKRTALVEEYNTRGISGKRHNELKIELAKINEQKKAMNKFQAIMLDNNEYKLLRAYLHESGGSKFLEDFDNFVCIARKPLKERVSDTLKRINKFPNSEPNPQRSVATSDQSGNKKPETK